jgi:hypothetical protein
VNHTELNIEAVKLYISHGGQDCLFCGADSPEGSSFNVSDGAARQEMFCSSCDKEWTDSYHLASVTHGSEVYEPDEEVETLKAEIEKLKSATMDSLTELWTRLRTSELQSRRPDDVMGDIARFIAEKRGDTRSLCGCGGSLHHYDGLLGYESMVCDVCEQHFPVI